jgi:transposase
MGRTKRSFTKEYKAEVVKLVGESGKSPSAIARDLGLTTSVVGSWCRQARMDAGEGPPGALTSDEKAELAQLRKECRQLRMERDFLKKTTAFFAREST